MDNRSLPESTRLPGVPSIEVVLADRRAWGLARPRPLPCPRVIDEVDRFGRRRARVELTTRVGYPLHIRRLRDAVLAGRGAAGGRQAEAFRRLLVALLREAHDIDQARAEGLIDPARVDLARIARAVVPEVFGGDSNPCPAAER